MSFDHNADDAVEAPPAIDPFYAKWTVLFFYSYLSGLQSLLWMTFSSVPEYSEQYLNVSEATLDLWLDYGPIAFCVTVLPALSLLSARGAAGLRDSIRCGLCLCAFSAALRALPLAFPSRFSAPGALALVHVAQFVNGAVAPLAVASPAALSLLWFPDSQRNAITAVANVANAAGRAVGFWLGPALVARAGDVPTLLLVEAALAGGAAAAALLYCPAAPAVPPSRAAAAEAARAAAAARAGGKGGGCARGFVRSAAADVAAAVRAPGVALVVASGGLTMAFYGAWSGVLPSVLADAGYSPGAAGALGAANTLAGCVGGVAAALATDARAVRRALKPVLLSLSLGAAALFAVPALAPDAPAAVLLLAATGAGALRGGLDPLLFEAAADAAAAGGASAAAAGALLTLVYHLALCAVLSLAPATLRAIAVPGLPAALLAGGALLACARIEPGTRRDVGGRDGDEPAEDAHFSALLDGEAGGGGGAGGGRPPSPRIN
jgi:CP family cyanate transporter-like MFS transporter